MAVIAVVDIQEDKYKDLATIAKIRHKFNAVNIAVKVLMKDLKRK